MLTHFSPVQLYATLWTITHQASLSTGFSRQEYWSTLLCPPIGDLPDSKIKPGSPALQVGSLPLSHWKAQRASISQPKPDFFFFFFGKCRTVSLFSC